MSALTDYFMAYDKREYHDRMASEYAVEFPEAAKNHAYRRDTVDVASARHEMFALGYCGAERVVADHEGRDWPANFLYGRFHKVPGKIPDLVYGSTWPDPGVPLTADDFDPDRPDWDAWTPYGLGVGFDVETADYDIKEATEQQIARDRKEFAYD